jgi:NAD(P)-dependent dehydrogenase (short-subunit alcohol dehydrogenase family)
VSRPVAERVALVTGGASGIGRATVGRLAAEGETVVVADVDERAGQVTADEVGGHFLRLDVADPDSWAALVAAIEERFGHLDDVHLNAGVLTGSTDVVVLTDEQYRRVTGVNVDGVVFGLRAVVPLLAAGGGGAVVATASVAGLVPFTIDPIYTLTKHAVVGLVRALAPQLLARGITIDAICPSLVDTPLLGEAREPLRDADFPLIDPDDVAAAVVGALRAGGAGRTIACQVDQAPVEVGPPPLPEPGTERPLDLHAG